jgi:hypothetical protein
LHELLTLLFAASFFAARPKALPLLALRRLFAGVSFRATLKKLTPLPVPKISFLDYLCWGGALPRTTAHVSVRSFAAAKSASDFRAAFSCFCERSKIFADFSRRVFCATF